MLHVKNVHYIVWYSSDIPSTSPLKAMEYVHKMLPQHGIVQIQIILQLQVLLLAPQTASASSAWSAGDFESGFFVDLKGGIVKK